MDSDKTVKKTTQLPNTLVHEVLGTAIALMTLGLPLYSTAHYSTRTAFLSPSPSTLIR